MLILSVVKAHYWDITSEKTLKNENKNRDINCETVLEVSEQEDRKPKRDVNEKEEKRHVEK